jgi:hypothetical protein
MPFIEQDYYYALPDALFKLFWHVEQLACKMSLIHPEKYLT